MSILLHLRLWWLNIHIQLAPRLFRLLPLFDAGHGIAHVAAGVSWLGLSLSAQVSFPDRAWVCRLLRKHKQDPMRPFGAPVVCVRCGAPEL